MKDLETENLKIRKFKMQDAEDIYNNIATENKLNKCIGYNMHQNVEQTRTMISSYINEYEADELVWAIEEKKTNTAIGYINALEVSKANKYCNIKFGIALKHIEGEYMNEALKSALEYLFTEKDFNMVISKFYDGNKEVANFKSQVLDKLGMVKEAVLRNRVINSKTGELENSIIYSITKNEFLVANKN